MIKAIKSKLGHLEISQHGESIEDCLNEAFKQSSSANILIGGDQFIYVRMSQFLWDKDRICDIKYTVESNKFENKYKNLLFDEVISLLEKFIKLSPIL